MEAGSAGSRCECSWENSSSAALSLFSSLEVVEEREVCGGEICAGGEMDVAGLGWRRGGRDWSSIAVGSSSRPNAGSETARPSAVGPPVLPEIKKAFSVPRPVAAVFSVPRCFSRATAQAKPCTKITTTSKTHNLIRAQTPPTAYCPTKSTIKLPCK